MGSHSRQREMSSRSPAVSKKTNGRLNGRAEPEVTEDGLDLSVIDRVQDYLRKISDMTSKVPDQVQKSLVTIYMSINSSMMTALESAESIIKAAQDKTKEQSPLINTALEQLIKATGELTRAAKKVQDLLETIKEDSETEENNTGKSSK